MGGTLVLFSSPSIAQSAYSTRRYSSPASTEPRPCTGSEVQDPPNLDCKDRYRFDKISDIFSCDQEYFGRAVEFDGINRNGGLTGPAFCSQAFPCQCRDEKKPRSRGILSAYTMGASSLQHDNDQYWSTMSFVFKDDAPTWNDRESEKGISFTNFRIQLLSYKGVRDVFSIEYPSDKTKVSLFIERELPSGASDHGYITSSLESHNSDEIAVIGSVKHKHPEFLNQQEIVSSKDNLSLYLQEHISHVMGEPYVPAWSWMHGKTRRGEVVDFVLHDKGSAIDTRRFERKLEHCFEFITNDPYGEQPVFAQKPGWVDPETNTCSQSLISKDTNTYRVVFWWDSEEEEAEWTRQFMEDDYEITGHRAHEIGKMLKRVDAKHVSLNWLNLWKLGQRTFRPGILKFLAD